MSTKTLRACWLGLTLAVPVCSAVSADDPPPTVMATTPAADERAILLKDGRILRGEMAESGKSLTVRQKGGVITIPKSLVEGFFDSIEAAYRYKANRIADNDPDEHRKLAQWCLTNKLHAEAMLELERVITLAPNDRQARTQIQNLKSAEQRQSGVPPVDDPAVRQAGFEDSGRAARGNSTGRPEIFDLPPALAFKRYQEFALNVHPVLQRRCVNCHNERSGLPFQIVKANSARDLRDEMILRTNLEATLELIDRQDPGRSVLLLSAILPHRGANNRPILENVQHADYKSLAQWVAGVSTATPQAEASPLLGGPAATGFGSQRRSAAGSALPTFASTPPSAASGSPMPNGPAPTSDSAVKPTDVQHPNVPNGVNFPDPRLPLAMPGPPPLPNPNPVAVPASAGFPAVKPMNPGQPLPTMPPGGPPVIDPNAPGMAPVKNPTKPDPASLYPAEVGKKDGKSKSKFSPEVLGNFLRGGRQAPATPTPKP